MLYTLTLYNDICQLYLNVTRKNVKKEKPSTRSFHSSPYLHYLHNFFSSAVGTFWYQLNICEEFGRHKARISLDTLTSQLLALTGISCVRKQ